MALANPCLHQTWSEYKKEREAGRKRRLSWMQRVMRWDKINENDPDQQETDEEEDDDREMQDDGSEQNERQGYDELLQENLIKFDKKWQNIDRGNDKEVDSVSDGDTQDERLEQKGIMVEKLKHRQDFDDEDDDGEVQDERLEQNQKFFEKQAEKRDLEESVDMKTDKISGKLPKTNKNNGKEVHRASDGTIQDDRSEQSRETTTKRKKKIDFEKRVQIKCDVETQFQPQDDMESYYQESQNTCGSEEEDFGRETWSEVNEFDCLSYNSDPFRCQDSYYNDDESLEKFRLDLAMGGAEETVSPDKGHFEVHDNPRRSSSDKDSTENGQMEENGAKKFKQDEEFDFFGPNSAENGERRYEELCHQNTEKVKPLEACSFENSMENGAVKSEEAGEPSAKPRNDLTFDDPDATSTCFEKWRRSYTASFNQNTAESKNLAKDKSESLTEDGGRNCEEFCNQDTERDRDLEVDRLENLAGNDEATISTQEKVEKVSKPRDEISTEEETTTTDEDDDNFCEDDVDCYDLNEIKLYKHDNHAVEIFQNLLEFKDAQIFTDLELKTSYGKSLHAHTIVLSAVSYPIKRFLIKKNGWFWDRKIHIMEVGEEVEFEALKAVVEFAYTGAIQCLSASNVGHIKTAAQYLSAERVVEICDRELSKNKKKNKDKSVPASTELKISLEQIEELWTNELGCDITLDVLSASFKVHKVILAACSDYFRAMFTLGMKESSQSSIYLQFLSASELETLLTCSYTGSISLTWNSIFETTSTALQLQYQPALDLCLSFLQREINPHSCLDVASFAEAFGILKLFDHAEDYILRQFQKVARTPKFKDLPGRNLLRYLNSFSLCVPSELVVFKAVVDWIQAKPKRRLKLAKELMKTIHFPLMTFKEFKEVQALSMWSNHSLHELYEAIFEDFWSNEIETQNKCRIYLPKESLVLSGGDQISEDLGTRSISKDLWFGNSLRNHTGIKKAMEWRQLGQMPQPGRFGHEVAVIQGKLYLLGGKKYYGTGDTLNSFYRYDPIENRWEELCPMLQARCSFSLVVFGSKLIAIGGQCHPDYLETVEQYCPTANSWSFTCPLDLPLGGHVARVLAGHIFISGGLNNDYDSLSSMMSYHPEKGCSYLENMAHPRALHCMEVLGDFLYVAGGLSQTDSGSIVDMLACEMYNPEDDTWTSFPPLPVPHVGAGSAVLEGKFYVLGGYSQVDYSDVKMVHRFDPATNIWENMGKMPGPNNDLKACVLCLPEHLRLCPD